MTENKDPLLTSCIGIGALVYNADQPNIDIFIPDSVLDRNPQYSYIIDNNGIKTWTDSFESAKDKTITEVLEFPGEFSEFIQIYKSYLKKDKDNPNEQIKYLFVNVEKIGDLGDNDTRSDRFIKFVEFIKDYVQYGVSNVTGVTAKTEFSIVFELFLGINKIALYDILKENQTLQYNEKLLELISKYDLQEEFQQLLDK